MSWLIIGTVPDDGFPLTDVPCRLIEGKLRLGDRSLSVARGTPALLATACICAQVLGCEPPRALLVGDIGHGEGSSRLYHYLSQGLKKRTEDLLVFHYLQPDVDWHNRLLCGIEELSKRPCLLADAGYMYVAKMSGFASSYDLFFPDVGEMAFLADESAPHPFYTRGFLLQEEGHVPELIRRAYEHENASRHLLVKGKTDYVVAEGRILARISEPSVEAMEPIGGTGDSLTGIAAALIFSGQPIPEAAKLAARINRFLGQLSNPTPAFSVADLLPALPEAIELVLPQCHPG